MIAAWAALSVGLAQDAPAVHATLATLPTLAKRAPEGLAFVTESGVPLDPLSPPGDWLVLQEGRPIGPRRFARVVQDRERERSFSFGDRQVYFDCVAFSLLGAVPAVATLAGQNHPDARVLVPAGLGWSAGWLLIGAWYSQHTGGKRAVRGYYALDEAVSLSLGEPVARDELR